MPSPTPPGKNKEMSFNAALGEIIMGHKVARKSWQNDHYCYMKNEFLTINTGKDENWIISLGDLEGNDWEVKS